MTGDEVPFAIDVDGLVKRFDGRTVVDGFSIRVKRGEIFGFLGLWTDRWFDGTGR